MKKKERVKEKERKSERKTNRERQIERESIEGGSGSFTKFWLILNLC